MQEQALEATSAMSTAAVGLVGLPGFLTRCKRMQTWSDAQWTGCKRPIRYRYNIYSYIVLAIGQCATIGMSMSLADPRPSTVDYPLGVQAQDAIPPIFHSTRFPWHRNNEPPSALTACGSSLVIDGRRTSNPSFCVPLHCCTQTPRHHAAQGGRQEG